MTKFLQNNQNSRAIVFHRGFSTPMLGVFITEEDALVLSPVALTEDEEKTFGSSVERKTVLSLDDVNLIQFI